MPLQNRDFTHMNLHSHNETCFEGTFWKIIESKINLSPAGPEGDIFAMP